MSGGVWRCQEEHQEVTGSASGSVSGSVIPAPFGLFDHKSKPRIWNEWNERGKKWRKNWRMKRRRRGIRRRSSGQILPFFIDKKC